MKCDLVKYENDLVKWEGARNRNIKCCYTQLQSTHLKELANTNLLVGAFAYDLDRCDNPDTWRPFGSDMLPLIPCTEYSIQVHQAS